MNETSFVEFHAWLVDQKANGGWGLLAEYIDNRISTERDLIMMHLGELSRENQSAVNSLVECRARIDLLEAIRDLPVAPMQDIVSSVNPS
jgi:hypothetical protein